MKSPPTAARFPLSSIQRGMLFDNLRSPGSGVDVIQSVIEIEERLDDASFERAWARVIAAHPTLRTVFQWTDVEEAQQRVLDEVPLRFRSHDWSTASRADRAEQWEVLVAEDRYAVFDLGQAPLMRVQTVHWDADVTRVLWTTHHALMDGRSLVLVFAQVLAAYDALRSGAPYRVPASRSFRDYVEWLQGWLRDRDRAADEAFWRGRELPGTPRIPDDRGVTAAPRCQRRIAKSSGGATARLESWLGANDLTLNTAVQGAWSILLSRYCTERRVVFGAVKSSRKSSVDGANDIVGPLLNTLPVAVDVDPRREVVAWLRDLRSQWIALREVEHTPLSDVREWSGIGGSQPLFDSVVCFDPVDFTAALRAELSGPRRCWFEVLDQTSYSLSLNAYGGPELTLLLRYDPNRIEDAAIDRLLGHLQAVLEAFPENGHARLEELSMLRPGELDQLLGDQAGVSRPYPRDRCVHELFERQAARTPDAVAVADGVLELTYRELDGRGNRLARHLRARGVGPEVAVAILVPRSIDLIVGLLGILKAGGAYVPLDPHSPKARLARVLADARASLVLTTQRQLRDLPDEVGEVICMDVAESELAGESAAPLDHATRAEHLAYVVHTSGSTGAPKGIAIPHRGVVRLVLGTDYVELGPGEVMAQIAPASFDAATFEIWGALLNGGRLELFPPQVPSADELGRAVRDRGVTTMFATTALFRQLVDRDLDRLRGVRQLLAGGETHSVAHIRRYLETLGDGRRFMNVYGPTEGTTYTTCQPMTAETVLRASAPIGRPIANTRVYVLDSRLDPVPVGVPGELWIAGDGLARGYLDARLTAERFVPDPFGEEPGGRLYRSGDLVRYLDDGSIDFLGRLDDQVKIRGFRVEPGEVEAALLQADGVAEAAVVVREDSPGERRLVAYVVPAEGAECAPDALRGFLGERLPAYMVPFAVALLDELPLNRNGKIDRDALPMPRGRQVATAMVLPRNPVEEDVAGVWLEVLPVQEIGVHDNFFELGGHSLLAMQVVSRLRDSTGIEIGLADVFGHPTVAELAQRVADAGLAVAGPDEVRHGDQEPVVERAPLTFAERRLWFLQRMFPESGNYNVGIAWRVCGPLRVDALEAGLTALVERHGVLRTTFAEVDGAPVRVVHDPAPIRLRKVDVGGDGGEQRVRSLVDEEMVRPFDLASEPPLRSFLLRVGENDHVLLAVMHHIATDGWSLGIFARELGELYDAELRGEEATLDPLGCGPLDHAARQQRELRADALAPHLAYWKAKLAGSESLELPADRPRPRLPSFAGEVVSIDLPGRLIEEVERLGLRAEASLFMTLLAAFDVLLLRHTGQRDIVVGSPVAGRDRTDLEGSIGCFVNTLPLRADLSGEPSFVELLGRVRNDVLEALRHQALPFERLVEELDPARDPGRNPVYQVLFAVQNAPAHCLTLRGAVVAPFAFPRRTTHLDLDVHVWPNGDGARVDFAYSTDLFDSATVERMAGQYRTILEGVVAGPERRLSSLPVLSGAERRQLVVDWNATERDGPVETVHRLVESQVDRVPDATAVAFEDDELSYSELDARANRLARHLVARGGGTRIGLCVDRSPDVVVAALAILKTGAAYVPLDPSHPAARLSHIAADAGLTLVVSRGDVGHLLPPDVAVVDLGGDLSAIDAESPARLGVRGSVDDVANVIYTSGSTGRPKGVEVTHRNLANFLDSMRREPGFAPGDRLLAVTTVSFDIAGLELFLPLVCGARVEIASTAVATDAELLRRRLDAGGVTVMQATPATWQMLVDAGWKGATGLKMLCGGEALPRDLADRLLPLGRELWNLYGPTETTIWSAIDRVRREGGVVPIGRGIANTELYVLSAGMEPVPIGVHGELYIGGEGVTRGYAARPALTAERFVPDPFSSSSGRRLYRTGDRARWRADGRLEFLRRVDTQIKLRGHRIELGEIEVVARELAGVQDAVAVVREERPGDRRLVLYFVSAGAPLEPGDVRRALARSLPASMLPSAVVGLESLPRNPHGKIDRQRVASIRPPSVSGEDRVAPQGATQGLVAGAFAAVLGVDDVGAYDDFFEAGGHSLLATQLVSRLRDEIDVELPISQVFLTPTVADLARYLDEAPRSGPRLRQGVDVGAGSAGVGQLSSAQQRMWFLDRLGAGAAYNVALVLRLEGELDVAALRGGLGRIVQRHAALRTTFPSSGGQPSRQIDPAAALCFETAELPEERVRDRIEAEIETPFDLATGPLFRARLFRVAKSEHVLVCTAHHIVFDWWSWEVLQRELSECYAAAASGREPRLAPLPDLGARPVERDMAYWREQLRDVPVVDLPLDRPRPAVWSFRGAHCDFELPAELVADLDELCRRSNATRAMVLLAAYQVLLARYSGAEDVAVGMPTANRTETRAEGAIGLFVNTLVLRTDLSGDPGFEEVVRRTRRVSLEALDHQAVPFERLVEELAPTRDTSQNPLFQAGFQMQRVAGHALALPGLQVSPFPFEFSPARVDLELHLFESDGTVAGRMVYARDLFDRATIEGVARHYVQLLRSALSRPAASCSKLPLQSRDDELAMVAAADGAEPDSDCQRLMHELIEERARRAPEAAAVVSDDVELSYAELNAEANRLAWALRERGVAPDVLVGLCVERSVELVVGMLGIMKAGGAFLPIDPEYPRQRVAHMLEDSGVSLVLTRERWLASLPATAASTLCFDRDAAELTRRSAGDLPALARADHLAYAIYTSGSTGAPKGALLTHRGLSNVVAQQRRVFGLTGSSRVLSFSSPSFDAATFEVAMALPAGATLVLRPSGLLPGRDLVELLRRHRVSIVTLPPVALAAMPVDRLPDLETITVAGEACPLDLVTRWAPGRRFFNLYGPTEATIWSTAASLSPGAETVTIGRAIAGVTAHVLDRHLAPVPVGAIGELCLGGQGVGRGYLRRPSLTAERFVPDPFARRPGRRLYRTGDLVRRRHGGELEFVGRSDHQVKVRGHRIEPGEIEATLRRHTGVGDAVAVCREADGGGELVAYVVPGEGARPTPADLRRFLAESLPAFMVPTAIVVLDALPLTPAGKVDRASLPAPELDPAEEAPARSELQRRIAAIWCEILGLDHVGVRDRFFDVGGHSLRLVRLQARLEEELGREIAILDLFRHPTVEALARHLGDDEAARVLAAAPVRPRSTDSRIAVIAVAGRFPAAADVDEFWRNLCDGVEGIRFFTEDELRHLGVDELLIGHPDFVRAHGELQGADLFDAGHFGYSPREAQIMDPQHRVFLECALEALERAGCDPERYSGSIGVYAGASRNDYLAHVQSHPGLASAAGLEGVVGTDKDFLATRASYKLGLRGPGMTVQTACSTSLVAVHEACRALLDFECDVALAGGVSISVPRSGGYLYREGDIASPDGHCRPFDALAGGTLGGDGVGIVALKRFEEAARDGDDISAVILGTAVNNDGSDKVGYTAPSIEGQARVIAMAQAAAGVEPDSISYVEAHGTATPLGDPIEVAALTRAFRRGTDRVQFCGLGSVKSNVGHLDAAAGIAGLIKTVLALRHGRLPPSLHFESPNPKIDFASSPFYVVAEGRPWPAEGERPRRAGVSSFGIGGTNAHVVLEEAPAPRPSGPSRPWQLLVVSAKSGEALDVASSNLAEYLRAQPSANLADVAHTLRSGRRELEHRRAVVGRTTADAIAALSGERPEATRSGYAGGRGPVAFLFPGHGHQRPRMGYGLYASEPVFRDAVDRGLAHLEGQLDFDLRAALFPETDVDAAAEVLLSRPSVFQPAVFLIDWATARLWQSWGIEPTACLGHSLGEYVAAAVAGVLSFEDALELVVLRGRLMEQTPGGAMLSIELDEHAVRELIASEDAIWLSTINAPELCIVAGEPEAIEAFAAKLEASGVVCHHVPAAYAYHSGMMESGVAALADAVRQRRVRSPAIPYLSNVSGDWITEEQIRDPAYWGRHLAAPVRFSDGLQKLLEDPELALFEAGPGRMLTSLARKQPSCGRDRVVVSSLPHPDSDVTDEEFSVEALGRLWAGGVRVDWARYGAGERRRLVELPTYPFQRQRYWIERRVEGGRRADMTDWFYVPVWRRARWRREATAPAGGCAVLFAPETELDRALARQLASAGRAVVTVTAGAAFDRRGDGFVIDPGSREDYARMLAEVTEEHGVPGVIAHLWSVASRGTRLSDDAAKRAQRRGVHSVLHLLSALGDAELAAPLRLCVVTGGVHEVTGREAICPEQATVLGPCRTAGLELGNVSCHNIDLEAAAGRAVGGRDLDGTVSLLCREISSPTQDPVVALRDGHRWVQSFAPASLPEVEGAHPRRLRPRGAYLLTGGLGGIGLAISADLARSVQARLILTGRRALDESGEKRAAVDMLGELGAEVLYVQADVCDVEAMRGAVAAGLERFGRIDGVVHLAGLPGGADIAETDPAEVDRVLAPKVTGTRVLEQVLEGVELDFLVLASSIITSWGMRGWVDYCAANAYLDAFAHRYAADTGAFVVALDWARWRESGMAADAARDRGVSVAGISDREGVEVFRRVLDHAEAPQILVSDVDFRDPLQARPDSVSELDSLDVEKHAHERPRVSTDYAAPRDEAETKLAEVWQRRLGIDRVGVHDNFFELGGDSVQAIHIVSAAREAGIGFTVKDLLRRQTVAAVAAIATTAARLDAEQGPVTGPVRMTPIQSWFFEQDPIDPDHFNVPLLLEARSALDPALLAEALDSLAWHHDALRLRCRVVDGVWRQEIAAPGESVPLETIDLGDTEGEERERQIEAHASRLQASLDLRSGPIVRAALLRSAGQSDRLLVVVHHVAVDIVSWRILLDDLARAMQGGGGGAAALPRKTTSIRAWGEYLAESARSPATRQVADSWLELPWADARDLPVDRPGGDNRAGSIRRVSASLSAEQTDVLLRGAKSRSGPRVDDVLLAALARCLVSATGGERVLVDVETHGRESDDDSIDVSRTVGWFTSIYPVLLDLAGVADPGAALARVREQMRWFRDHELGYRLGRFLSDDEELVARLRALPRPRILFVYHGQLDQMIGSAAALRWDRSAIGPSRSPRARRSHAIEIEGSVYDGVLQLTWIYSPHVHREQTIRALHEQLLANLDALVSAAGGGVESAAAAAESFGWSDHDVGDIMAEIDRLTE